MSRRLVSFLLIEDDEDHAELIMRNFESDRNGNTIERLTDGVQAEFEKSYLHITQIRGLGLYVNFHNHSLI